MSNENDHPAIERCACGARLIWQSRESAQGKRWMALCGSQSCGAITTSPHEGDSGHSELPARRQAHQTRTEAMDALPLSNLGSGVSMDARARALPGVLG